MKSMWYVHTKHAESSSVMIYMSQPASMRVTQREREKESKRKTTREAQFTHTYVCERVVVRGVRKQPRFEI